MGNDKKEEEQEGAVEKNKNANNNNNYIRVYTCACTIFFTLLRMLHVYRNIYAESVREREDDYSALQLQVYHMAASVALDFEFAR